MYTCNTLGCSCYTARQDAQHPGGQLGVTADGDARSKWGAGRQPRGKKMCRLSFENSRDNWVFEAHFSQARVFTVWPESCLQPAAPSAERLPSMQHAAFSAAACLPLGHYLTLPVRLACNLQPWQRQQSNDVHFCGLRRRMLLLLKRTIRFYVSGAACAFACCAAACCCPPRSGGLR